VDASAAAVNFADMKAVEKIELGVDMRQALYKYLLPDGSLIGADEGKQDVMKLREVSSNKYYTFRSMNMPNGCQLYQAACVYNTASSSGRHTYWECHHQPRHVYRVNHECTSYEQIQFHVPYKYDKCTRMYRIYEATGVKCHYYIAHYQNDSTRLRIHLYTSEQNVHPHV
jgi:hypothetical protein